MTIKYFDVSHYQGNYSPVGPTAAKATEGATYLDPMYATIKSRTLAKGYPFWAYHYLRNGGVAAQAHFAYGVIQKTPMMVDFEANGGFLPNCVQFIDAYRGLGGICNVVYLPNWYWQQIGRPDLQPLKDRKISLVSSNYQSYSDNGPGWTPYGGMTPSIWQYTSTPLDTNAYKGSLAQLEALWSGNGDDMSQADVDAIVNKLLPEIRLAQPSSSFHNPQFDPDSTGKYTKSLSGKLDKIDSGVSNISNTLSNQATVAQIAAAVVAALPPASAGGLTKGDVEAAVIEVLSRVKVV